MYYHSYNTHIKSYELEFSPHLFQMYISGKLEVVSPFEIPPQSLFTKIILPNQTINDVELIPDKREYCISEKGRCGVFRIKTLFTLSGDKYFSRDIGEYEKIPIKMFFELKTLNWDIFKNLNGIHNAHDYKYIGFINHLKLLELNNFIYYRNSFWIERTKFESSWNTVDVPIKWKIGIGYSNFKTERIKFSIKTHDLLNTPIKELFTVYGPKDLEIEPHGSLLTLPNKREVALAPPEKITSDRKNIFRLSEGISRNKDGSYAVDPLKKEIFIYEKSQGFLKHKLLMKLKNNGFYINIKNHYSFSKEINPNIPGNSKIMVLNKEKDNHFFHLNKFNYIDF